MIKLYMMECVGEEVRFFSTYQNALEYLGRDRPFEPVISEVAVEFIKRAECGQ